MTQTNYLIIGSGVAGLTFALKMATRFPEKTLQSLPKPMLKNRIQNMPKEALLL